MRLPRNQIIEGDVRHVLPTLPDASVDCVITSPPYFALRNYGEDEQIGLEASIERWVEQVVDVVEASGRLLKPTGSLWLNLGDSYSRHQSAGAPAKSLLLGPERIVLELTRRGWTVRNKIVWAKTNPMPSSVKDRLSCTWESIYLLTRSRHYYFDLDAIRIPHRTTRTVGAHDGKHHRDGRADSIHCQTGLGRAAGREPIRAESRQGSREGRTPARQEPRGRLAPGHLQLPRRPLRHLPRTARHQTAAGQLPRTGLHQLRQAVATWHPPPGRAPGSGWGAGTGL